MRNVIAFLLAVAVALAPTGGWGPLAPRTGHAATYYPLIGTVTYRSTYAVSEHLFPPGHDFDESLVETITLTGTAHETLTYSYSYAYRRQDRGYSSSFQFCIYDEQISRHAGGTVNVGLVGSFDQQGKWRFEPALATPAFVDNLTSTHIITNSCGPTQDLSGTSNYVPTILDAQIGATDAREMIGQFVIDEEPTGPVLINKREWAWSLTRAPVEACPLNTASLTATRSAAPDGPAGRRAAGDPARAAAGTRAPGVPTPSEASRAAPTAPSRRIPPDQKERMRDAAQANAVAAGVFGMMAIGCAATGVGAPATLVFGGVSAISYAAMLRTRQLANDPPDPNYREIPTPVARIDPNQALVVGGLITPEVAAAGNTLFETLGRLIGFEEAMFTAINRADGAQDAGDTVWEARQLDAAKRFSAEAGALAGQVPAQLAALHTALKATGYKVALTPAQGVTFQSQVRASGWPAWLSSRFDGLAVSSAEQEELRQSFLSLDGAAAVTQVGGEGFAALMSPQLHDAYRTLATALDAFGRPRPNVGVAPAPVTTGGQLQVTIQARDAACTTNNTLLSLRFTRLDNATVEIPGAGIVSAVTGQAIPLAGGPASVVLTLRRVQAGRSTTAALVVTDGCGEWPTFFGGGPAAF